MKIISSSKVMHNVLPLEEESKENLVHLFWNQDRTRIIQFFRANYYSNLFNLFKFLTQIDISVILSETILHKQLGARNGSCKPIFRTQFTEIQQSAWSVAVV